MILTKGRDLLILDQRYYRSGQRRRGMMLNDGKRKEVSGRLEETIVG